MKALSIQPFYATMIAMGYYHIRLIDKVNHKYLQMIFGKL